jgi:hypothetical protein
VAIVNWLIPGAGYLLLGQFARGLAIGFTILILFTLGILIGGIHVVDPPSFGGVHGLELLRAIFSRPGLRSIFEKPGYIGQFLAGAIGLICGYFGPNQPASHSRVNDIGTLYTAVAGMLNLMATLDSAHRATLDVADASPAAAAEAAEAPQ